LGGGSVTPKPLNRFL